MIAEIEYDEPNAHFGTDITVCVVHLHHRTAKRESGGGFKESWGQFWPFLAELLRDYNVSILCGDFNMSLLCMVP